MRRWCSPRPASLFAGVVSRYVFDSPIMWTDELGTFLFLWLAMFGAVVALRRDGHMRLTTFVNWCSPAWGNWLGTVAELVVIVFVLEIIFPARKYLAVQTSTELITLHTFRTAIGCSRSSSVPD